MKFRLSQKLGMHTPSSAPSMSKRSHQDPWLAPATIPEGTPIRSATNSEVAIRTSVGSARSQSAWVTGRSRK